MSNEEKEAIEKLKEISINGLDIRKGDTTIKHIDILLKYIDKLQKEIRKMKKENKIQERTIQAFVNTSVDKEKIRNMIKDLNVKNENSTGVGYGFAIYYLKELLKEE